MPPLTMGGMLESLCDSLVSLAMTHTPGLLAQTMDAIDRAPAPRAWIAYVIAGVLAGLIVAISIKGTKRYQD